MSPVLLSTVSDTDTYVVSGEKTPNSPYGFMGDYYQDSIVSCTVVILLCVSCLGSGLMATKVICSKCYAVSAHDMYS